MQKEYDWLLKEPGPKMLIEALKLIGIKEITGKENSREIMEWALEVGINTSKNKPYSNDEIPWCGLFMAVVAKRAGKEVPKGPLWALNWAKFGLPVQQAMLGDVITFKRPKGGHVGLYVGEDKVYYHILGGNQKNAVTISQIEKNRRYSITRPVYSIGQPANVRKIMLDIKGTVSTNEA